MDSIIPRLTGGIFFNFLLLARKDRYTHLENSKGKRDCISDYELLGDLIRIVRPSHSDCSLNTMKKNTSDYKSCNLNNSQWLPLSDADFIYEFNNQIANKYIEIEKRAADFTTRYLSMDNAIKYRTTAHMFLALIQKDNTIDDNATFNFGKAGILTKKEMLKENRYEFHSLILAIWHFIISNKIINTEGFETYSKWTTSIGEKHSNKLFIPIINVDDFTSTIILPISKNNIKFDNLEDVSQEDNTSYKIPKFLKKINTKYNKLKTLLYNDEPHKFYDFYTCNDLVFDLHNFDHDLLYLIHSNNFNKDRITNASIDLLTKTVSNFIILSGTGGLGKSMMMRHLLLTAVKEYESTKCFPIFLPLKDFNSSYVDLFSFIYSKFKDLSTFTENDVKNYLYDGKIILLLDGLDEIKTQDLDHFYSSLESFADKYSNNTFILSTRPYSDTIHLSRFTTLRLLPFSKEKSLELIDKLEFRPDEPDIKSKFKNQLNETLYITHREFASNPLLLTIMLMTFEQYAEVPQKMHIFYREAFNTLAQKHDASKGAYKRILKTGLSTDRFADYLAEFCARTYYEEKFEFTETEFKKYFEELEEKNRYEDEKVNASAFLQDLRENMCLLYYEGAKYHFTHRSFQEYFCAVFFSKQKDKTLAKIGDMFEKRSSNSRRDQTFYMLNDMIPEKVEEYIFLPYLKKLITYFEKNDGYYTFLEKIYPEIQYVDVTDEETFDKVLKNPRVRPQFIPNDNMYMYYFIKKSKNLGVKFKNLNIPFDDSFINEYLYVSSDGKFLGFFHAQLSDNDIASELIEDSKVTLVGHILLIKIKKVLSDKEKYKNILNALNKKDFPALIEYNNLKNYYDKINNKKKVSSKDFFSNFF